MFTHGLDLLMQMPCVGEHEPAPSLAHPRRARSDGLVAWPCGEGPIWTYGAAPALCARRAGHLAVTFELEPSAFCARERTASFAVVVGGRRPSLCRHRRSVREGRRYLTAPKETRGGAATATRRSPPEDPAKHFYVPSRSSAARNPSPHFLFGETMSLFLAWSGSTNVKKYPAGASAPGASPTTTRCAEARSAMASSNLRFTWTRNCPNLLLRWRRARLDLTQLTRADPDVLM